MIEQLHKAIFDYEPHPELLKNKVILVTGASRGIGAAVSKSYAKHGATVILLARNIEALKKVYDEIESEGWATPAIYPMSFSKSTYDDFQTLKQTIETHFNQLDGVVLNAATLGALTPIEHYPLDQWYEVLQVNLNSQFLLIQSMIPLLNKSLEPRILFTLQPKEEASKAYWGPYGIATAGSHAFMKILSDEFQNHSKIKVNAITPTPVHTAIRNQAFPAENKSFLKMPEDLVSLYLFLMGRDNDSIHGECLSI